MHSWWELWTNITPISIFHPAIHIIYSQHKSVSCSSLKVFSGSLLRIKFSSFVDLGHTLLPSSLVFLQSSSQNPTCLFSMSICSPMFQCEVFIWLTSTHPSRYPPKNCILLIWFQGSYHHLLGAILEILNPGLYASPRYSCNIPTSSYVLYVIVYLPSPDRV